MNTDSISTLVAICSGYLFLPDSAMENCMFLGIYPFLLGCPICWSISVSSILLWFYFYYIHCNFSFISNFIWILSLVLKNFIYLFKEAALSFIDLSDFFLVSILFISALIFIISFLLLNLDFVFSYFSSSFRCKVGVFIWYFLSPWDRLLSLYTSLLELLLLYPIDFGLLCFHLFLSTF